MYNKQQAKVQDDEIYVDSYIRKRKINKPLNPMQKLGQKVQNMIPKMPNKMNNNKVRGVKNNKYQFNDEDRLSNFRALINHNYNVNNDVKGRYNRDVVNDVSFFSVLSSVCENDLVKEFKMKWSTKEKISKAQRKSNSNYKHGNRLDYRHISNWIPNEIIHHIDGDHTNNDESNLINIPGYIPDTNEIKTLGEWKRIVNCKLHEEIHRRACKDERELPTKDEIMDMINREYPKYFEDIRPKLKEHYEKLMIKDKYIEGNDELISKLERLKSIVNNEVN